MPVRLQVMGSRGFRVALLVFEAVWLNAIVPGHRRGIVPLPGENCNLCQLQPAEAACCLHHKRPNPARKEDQGKGDPAKHCAICYFAARLCTPPVIDLTPPPLRLAGELPFPIPQSRDSAEYTPAYYGRGPPTA